MTKIKFCEHIDRLGVAQSQLANMVPPSPMDSAIMVQHQSVAATTNNLAAICWFHWQTGHDHWSVLLLCHGSQAKLAVIVCPPRPNIVHCSQLVVVGMVSHSITMVSCRRVCCSLAAVMFYTAVAARDMLAAQKLQHSAV